MGILDDIQKLKATNPNTRNRYMLNFPQYNRPEFIPPEQREGYVKPNQVRPNNYDFYEFMDSPAGSTARGLVSDIGTGAANVLEAGKTGYNIVNQFGLKNFDAPIMDYFTSTSGQVPFNMDTGDEIRSKASKIDTTFDVTKNPFPEDSLIRKLGDNKYVKEIFGFIKNQQQNFNENDLASLDSNQDIGTTIVNKLSKDVDDGKVSDISQPQVNTIINATSEAAGAAGVIANASNKVTEAVGTKEKNETTADKLKSGIDTFLNDLDKPGFQVALAMHMEAKNGGDITSVLFEGMKVKKKAEKDLLAAHANNLMTSKAELQIMKLYQDLTKADEPSTNLIKVATQMMEKDYELGDQSSGAAFAISSMAMGIKRAEGISEFEALTKAIQLAESTKALKKDTWLSWGGKFDASKLFAGNAQTSAGTIPLSTLQTQANSLGINLQTAVNDAEMQGYQIDRTR
jgi:hypothetical protein